MAQKWSWQKILTVILHISGSIIWSWFLGHKCKMMTSPGVFFFIFSKFWFSGLLRGIKGQKKKWPKMAKNSVCLTSYLGNLHHMIVIFGARIFGKRAKHDPNLPISVPHALYLRNCGSYHQDFWYTGVKW